LLIGRIADPFLMGLFVGTHTLTNSDIIEKIVVLLWVDYCKVNYKFYRG